MLTEIRDRSSGVFAGVIAALIIIPMAFWGVSDYASTEANVSVATIGDAKITKAEFDARFSSEQQRLRQQMGENVNNDFLASDGFKQSVLEQMINRALIDQVALQNNYRVGNEQVEKAIRESDNFKLDGVFNAEAYERFIQSSPYSKNRYETLVRNDRQVQQIVGGYQESAIVLPDDVRELLQIQAEKRAFDLVTIKQADFIAGIEVEESEIQQYFDENQSRFMRDERMSIQYLELNLDDIAQDVEISEQELRDIYEQSKESFLSSAKRATRHILLSVTEDDDDESQKVKAESLVAELRAGGDFAELAKQHSQDPGSAANGGSLGQVELGQMVEEFETAAFALQENEISDPVRSQFGYHIIQVTSIQRPEQQSFNEVRFDLMIEEKERIAEDKLIELVSELGDIAYEQTDNLDGAADQMNLELKTSELFDRNSGQGIASFAELRRLAFSEEVLIDELNSEPLEVNPGTYVVIRKYDFEPAQARPLAEVSEQVKTVLITSKASAAAKAAGESLLERARYNWNNLVTEESLEVNAHVVSMLDQNRTVSQSVLQKVSSMNLADRSEAVGSTTDFNGDYHLIRLHTVDAGDLAGVSEQIKASTRQIIAQRNGSALLDTYIKSLNESIAPEINQDLL